MMQTVIQNHNCALLIQVDVRTFWVDFSRDFHDLFFHYNMKIPEKMNPEISPYSIYMYVDIILYN